MHEFQRITRLPPYVFAGVDELKIEARRRGVDIIDFGMGNPDLATPPHIVEKLVEAATNPRNHRYSASRGITRLRMAIADWYGRRYDVNIDPEEEAIVTIGVKEGHLPSGVGHHEPGRFGHGAESHIPHPYLRHGAGERQCDSRAALARG